jgi:hypothetical protein
MRTEFRSSAPDAGKIPGVLGMQNVLNSISMAVRVMKKALYLSYTRALRLCQWACHERLICGYFSSQVSEK